MEQMYRLEHPNVRLIMKVVAKSEQEARSQANIIMTHKIAAAVTKCGPHLCKDHELILRGTPSCEIF